MTDQSQEKSKHMTLRARKVNAAEISLVHRYRGLHRRRKAIIAGGIRGEIHVDFDRLRMRIPMREKSRWTVLGDSEEHFI